MDAKQYTGSKYQIMGFPRTISSLEFNTPSRMTYRELVGNKGNTLYRVYTRMSGGHSGRSVLRNFRACEFM